MICATRAFLATGWAENVGLTVEEGRISKIVVCYTPKPDDITVDTLLPALANLHSHSFQRAMAGMTCSMYCCATSARSGFLRSARSGPTRR